MILYGGPKEVVVKQLECDHNWHGACIDGISRYFMCLECFALDRDLKTTQEWREAVRASEAESAASEAVESSVPVKKRAIRLGKIICSTRRSNFATG